MKLTLFVNAIALYEFPKLTPMMVETSPFGVSVIWLQESENQGCVCARCPWKYECNGVFFTTLSNLHTHTSIKP